MRRFMAVVALVALTAGCTVTRSGEPAARQGEPTQQPDTTEFTIEDTDVRVEPGDTFSIVVEDNASVGDQWSVSGAPAADVVETGGDDYVADSDEPVAGGGGKRYFRFTAKGPGTTTIELRNCYRGCADPGDDHRYEIAVEVVA